MSEEISLTPPQLTKLLLHTIKAKLPTLTLGGPGLGKTALHEQAANSLGYDYLAIYPATHDPTDLTGLAFPTVGTDGIKRLVRHIDDLLATIFDAKKPLLVLLDEFGQAPPAMQSACAPLLLARKIGKYKVPDHVVICAASNRRQDRAGAANILTQLISRFATIVNLRPDAVSWLEKAMADKISPEIISFIKTSPSRLFTFNADVNYADQRAYGCPRSWYAASSLLRTDLPVDLWPAVFSGAVGVADSHLLIAHLTLIRSCVNVHDVVVERMSYSFPPVKSIGARWAFAVGVGAMANCDTIDRVIQVAQDIPSEYGIVALRQAAYSYPELDFSKVAESKLGKLILSSRGTS